MAEGAEPPASNCLRLWVELEQGETTETQRSHITCPMSHSWQAEEQVLNPGIDSRAHTSKHEANGFHLKQDQKHQNSK